MDPKTNEGIFQVYSTNSRACRAFNSRSKVMMESINVVVDNPIILKRNDVEEDAGTSF